VGVNFCLSSVDAEDKDQPANADLSGKSVLKWSVRVML